ncbi:MAG: phosphate ABC transporter substrate-binding protein [Pedobacter sp.]|nr:MAG: phosphate ABC transporter substrate-binding protein [Pedobacter sp.]
MNKVLFSLIAVILFASCKRKANPDQVVETRTSGEITLIVDESFSKILDAQIEVFQADYPDAQVNAVFGTEKEILPKFFDGKDRLIILSRMLSTQEEEYFKQKKYLVYTDRFAIDGIALITNKSNPDSLITVGEVYDIMRGKSDKKLVFDNAGSSTVRYFMDSAKVENLPAKGVYTLKTNNDVINYVAANPEFIGVVGINWLLQYDSSMASSVLKVKTLSVKGLSGSKGADKYYKPSQDNLINGKYPLLRNVYIINSTGTIGLGTGFANWLCGPRGQLIVLKSGLGPHKMMPRQFNIDNTKKK